MFGFGVSEIVILAAILILIFGPKKIPELARNIGESIRHIRGVFSSAEKKEDTSDKTDNNNNR
jgi:sec-independent protein translocase protein TatA